MSDQVDLTRDEKILKAKELYSQGSRNYLVKCYSEAADNLSQVCSLYEEIYGELSDELGMPYLLYSKSLIALALDENKVIDVPEEEEDDTDEEDEDENDKDGGDSQIQTNKQEKQITSKDGKPKNKKLQEIKEADSTENKNPANKDSEIDENRDVDTNKKESKTGEESIVTSTDDVNENNESPKNNGIQVVTVDEEKPSTSNGIQETAEDEDNEAASNLQLAWEILELAAKIFTRQGLSGLPSLAEVQTELGNIEFENNILDSAREDYEKGLKIYMELPNKNRRAMAEIYYKVGLIYLMQQLNQEGAESLKKACALIEEEIMEINLKENLTEKDKENVKDLEETKQEIWAKITEIEETRQQNIAEVRAALDNFIGPSKDNRTDGTAPSHSAASSTAITSSVKPTDISHLIKRKKPETLPNSEAEAAASPAKRPAL